MTTDTAHLGERISRPADEVYAYVADPAHLAAWAPGLGSTVEQVDGEWFVVGGTGRARVEFAPANAFGVLDHVVTPVSGEAFLNPLRVVPYGDDGCEIVFSVRRLPGTSDEEFTRDCGLVAADLARLRQILEASIG